MPMLIDRFARRWIYTAGVVSLIVGAICFSTHSLPGQVAGMLARIFGAGALSITLNLYIMDHIRKAEFVRPSWCAWHGRCSAGPAVRRSASCSTRISGSPPRMALSALFSLCLLILFWHYRLGDNPVIRPGKTRAVNPLVNIGRFVSQPRLRLAWLIAFGRSCFWTTFFVYGPILMVVTGEGKLAGGLLVSAGNALLFTASDVGQGRPALRRAPHDRACLPGDGVSLLLAGVSGEAAPAVGGRVPAVLRASSRSRWTRSAPRPSCARSASYERPQMAAVYRTYLDLSDLLPPLIYSIVLAFFGIGAVFATLGLFCAVCGVLTWRYLPKKM